MIPLLILASPALAAEPQTLTVSYTVRFDLPALVDQVCATTKMCDCTATWAGTGQLREASGERLTFEGTWKLTDGSCNEAFLLWAPPDGTAFHTLRLSADRATVTEWVAHDRLADTTRFESDIKARGQVWLSGMAAALDPATRTAAHFERASGAAGPFEIASEHRLTLTLSP